MGIILIILGISAISPIAPGLVSWVILPRIRKYNVLIRFFTSWLITLSLSLVYASREVSRGGFDDFGNVYYYRYLDMQSNGLIAFQTRFAEVGNISKIEVLYDGVLFAIAQYPIILNPNAVIFITTLFIGTLYQIWCFKYLASTISEKNRDRAISCCLMLFSFGLCSQTARQMLSIPFLLMAVWEAQYLWKLLFLILAATSHSSALMVFLIYAAFKQFPRVSFAIGVACVVVFSGSGMEIVQQYLESGGEAGVDKIQFYSGGAAQQHETINFTYVWIPVFLYIVTMFRGRQVGPDLKNLAAVGLIVYALLINVPLASYRATLFLTAALVGPIFVKSKIQFNWLGLRNLWLPNVLSFLMIFRRILNGRDGEAMSLWHKYDLIGVEPFYYIKNLFDGI